MNMTALTGKADAIENPTSVSYIGLSEAYDFFNEELFQGRLPRCLITMQRSSKALGYFWSRKFATRDGSTHTDEIALNPSHFRERPAIEILATLAHEMCHLEEAHFNPKYKSNGYHTAIWADMMEAIGLKPMGIPDASKRTGKKCHHSIVAGGAFETTAQGLIKRGFDVHFGEVASNLERAAKKRASKTKYTCPSCEANAWAKPDMTLICGDCDERMRPEVD